MTKKGKWLTGATAGAWLMYMLDPERGKRRRARTRDKIVHAWHVAGDAVGPVSRDLVHRTRGVLTEVRPWSRRESVPDEVLVERVRAKMGRFVSHPRSIEVVAAEGTVTLSGPILAHEAGEFLAAVTSVRGVRDVVDELAVHTEAGQVPGLQGGADRPGERRELAQANWAPATRFLAGVVGGSLAVAGVRRRGLLGSVLALVGSGLVTRGVTNIPFRRLAGAGGRRAVDFRKTINVTASVEEVFRFWEDLENFPRFMSHLREVRKTGEGLSHWTAAGPAGVSIEWDAEVTELVPNQLIAWRSIPGAGVGNAGIVRFDPNADGTTRIDIRMSYNPPAGALGHVVATLFGADPKHAMDEDLVRLQSILEEGKTTTGSQEVTLADLAEGSSDVGVGREPDDAESRDASGPRRTELLSSEALGAGTGTQAAAERPRSTARRRASRSGQRQAERAGEGARAGSGELPDARGADAGSADAGSSEDQTGA